MDFDFGIRTWYLKPTFWLKIIWGIFSFVSTVMLLVICSRTGEAFFREYSSSPLVISVFILIFLILAVCANCLFFFAIFQRYKFWIIIVDTVLTALVMILSICYGAIYGTESAESKADATILLHYMNQEHRTFFDKWLVNHGYDINSSDSVYNGIHAYTDQRMTQAASIILGLNIVWFILHCLVLFNFMQEDDYTNIDSAPLDTAPTTKFG